MMEKSKMEKGKMEMLMTDGPSLGLLLWPTILAHNLDYCCPTAVKDPNVATGGFLFSCLLQRD